MNDKQKFLDELSKIWITWREFKDDKYLTIVKFFKKNNIEYSLQVFFTKNNSTFYDAIFYYIEDNIIYQLEYDNLDLLLLDLKNLIKQRR